MLDMCIIIATFSFSTKKSYNGAELLNITFLLGMHCTSQVLHASQNICMQVIAVGRLLHLKTSACRLLLSDIFSILKHLHAGLIIAVGHLHLKTSACRLLRCIELPVCLATLFARIRMLLNMLLMCLFFFAVQSVK